MYSIRADIYIDGLNLYYRALRGTPHRDGDVRLTHLGRIRPCSTGKRGGIREILALGPRRCPLPLLVDCPVRGLQGAQGLRGAEFGASAAAM